MLSIVGFAFLRPTAWRVIKASDRIDRGKDDVAILQALFRLKERRSGTA
jgi:hypothetical protein